MASVRIPKGWVLPEREATPEQVALSFSLNRRKFLAALGVAALGTTTGVMPRRLWASETPYPAKRNSKFTLDRPVTEEQFSTRHNNFFEFSSQKDVWKYVDQFQTEPWTLKVTGLVKKPLTLDLSKLIRQMPLEERLYRHRCVEAWSMAVPWTGFPLKLLVDQVEPTSEARYIKFVSFLRPDEAPNQKYQPKYPWPQFQGLTLAEANHELAFLVTGMYGHELPKQNGAPIRLVVPWKYGFKSLKSLTAIEFTAEQPRTFWSDVDPHSYHFVANVDPKESHGKRSQATERDIGTGIVRPSQPYNGYGQFVAHLYE